MAEEYKHWREEPADNISTIRSLLATHTKAKHRGVVSPTCHPCMIITQKIIALEENNQTGV